MDDKCFLVEDILEIADNNVPENLQTLIASLKNPDIADYVVVAIFTLFLESGFAPCPIEDTITTTIGFDLTRLKQFENMPVGWKDSSKRYTIVFQLAQFLEHKCHFIALTQNHSLILNFTMTSDLMHDKCKYDEIILLTKMIKVSEYVSVREDSTNVPILKNMKELSFLIKDKVTSPLRALILNKKEIFPNPSLLGLPDEVLLKVLKYLKVKDSVSLSQSCSRLCELAQDDFLWQYYYKRDKISSPLNAGIGNASAPYKERYVQAKLAAARRFSRPASSSTRLYNRPDFHDYYYE